MQVVIPLSTEPLTSILHQLFEGELARRMDRDRVGLVFKTAHSGVKNKRTLILTDIAERSNKNMENSAFHASSILSLHRASNFLSPASEEAVRSGVAQVGFEGYGMEFVSMLQQLMTRYFTDDAYNRFRLAASDLVSLLSEGDSHSNGSLYFFRSPEEQGISLQFYRSFTTIGKPTERCGNRVYSYTNLLEVPAKAQA